MHPNPAFRNTPPQDNLAFARHRGFGILTVNADDGPLAAHVPFLIAEDGQSVDLHLARSNPIARAGCLCLARLVRTARSGADMELRGGAFARCSGRTARCSIARPCRCIVGPVRGGFTAKDAVAFDQDVRGRDGTDDAHDRPFLHDHCSGGRHVEAQAEQVRCATRSRRASHRCADVRACRRLMQCDQDRLTML
jgi:hypothetical protein